MITDSELFNIVAGKGIQFLDTSYDVVPTPEGYGLRAVNSKAVMVYFESFTTAPELTEALRTELETQMWAAITGQTPNYNLNWGA